jgi:hypothetical protein
MAAELTSISYLTPFVYHNILYKLVITYHIAVYIGEVIDLAIWRFLS